MYHKMITKNWNSFDKQGRYYVKYTLRPNYERALKILASEKKSVSKKKDLEKLSVIQPVVN